MLKTPYILVILLFIINPQSRAQADFIIDSVSIYNERLTPVEIASRIDVLSLNFNKLPDNRINFGLVDNNFRFVILKISARSTEQHFTLSIDNTSLDSVIIHQIFPLKGSSLLYIGGNLVPFVKERPYVWHTADLILSATPSYYLVSLKASQQNINVKLDIFPANKFVRRYQAYERVVFLYLGIVCIIVMITIIAFLLFRKEVFMCYFGYVLCVSVWILSHYSRIFQFVYPQLPWVNRIIKPISSLGAAVFLMMILSIVFKSFLFNSATLRRLLRFSLTTAQIMCCLVFLTLLPTIPSPATLVMSITWHIVLVLSAIVIIIIPIRFFKLNPVAKVFTCAMLFICLTSLMQLFANLGYLNNYFLNEHGMSVASIIEICIMAYGLFYSLFEEINSKRSEVLVLESERGETIKKLLAVQDNERKRIAGDLHDNIGPLLAALKINFRRLVSEKDNHLQEQLISKTECIIDDSIMEIRGIAHNLMPKGLSSKGLIFTLRDYFEELEKLYGKKIHFDHQVETVITPELQLNIYRIICELVLNAAKHSDAEHITITFTTDDSRLCLSIKDDGKGISVNLNDPRKALGIQNTESRVRFFNGRFNVKSERGKGTLIDMEIPLQLNYS